jgi:hypothetical protein
MYEFKNGLGSLGMIFRDLLVISKEHAISPKFRSCLEDKFHGCPQRAPYSSLGLHGNVNNPGNILQPECTPLKSFEQLLELLVFVRLVSLRNRFDNVW